MKANNYISKKEHRWLSFIAFVAFLFFSICFITQEIKTYNISVAENQQRLEREANGSSSSLQNNDNPVTELHFLTFIIFLSLLKTRRFIIPFSLTIFYAVTLIYSLPANFDAKWLGGEEFPSRLSFFRKLFIEANIYDYSAFGFILILLIWQISILFRIFKNQKSKNILP